MDLTDGRRSPHTWVPWTMPSYNLTKSGRAEILTSIKKPGRAPKEDLTIPADLIYYVGGWCVALVFLVSICCWSVNFFIKQFTERTYEQFRMRLTREAEQAMKLFREGLCEQIVLQENRTDSVAKLYALLIDLMRVGKDFTSSLGRGDFMMLEIRLGPVRETGDSFLETYQRQSLHFSEEFCSTINALLTDQKAVIQVITDNLQMPGRDPVAIRSREAEMKQSWLHFEDRITEVMEIMRNEFRSRRSAPGNPLMNWLREVPPPKSSSSPENE